MIELGMMSVAIQPRGRPDAVQVIRVAMHFNLSHLLDSGYEFPRVRLAEGQFGSWIEGPLQARAAA